MAELPGRPPKPIDKSDIPTGAVENFVLKQLIPHINRILNRQKHLHQAVNEIEDRLDELEEKSDVEDTLEEVKTHLEGVMDIFASGAKSDVPDNGAESVSETEEKGGGGYPPLEDALPESVYTRLQDAGFDTPEKVIEASDEELEDINYIGGERLKTIRETYPSGGEA